MQNARSSSGQTPELIHVTPGVHAIVDAGGVIAHLWTARATADHAAETYAVLERMAVRYPSGITSLTVVLQTSGIPGPGAREGLERCVRDYGELMHVVVVIQAEGFIASAVRTMMATLGIAGLNQRIRSARTLEQGIEMAIDVHRARTGDLCPRATILSAVQTAEAALQGR